MAWWLRPRISGLAASDARVFEDFVDFALNLLVAHGRQDHVRAFDALKIHGGLAKDFLARAGLEVPLLARLKVFAGAHFLADGAEAEAALVRLPLFDGHGVRLSASRLAREGELARLQLHRMLVVSLLPVAALVKVTLGKGKLLGLRSVGKVVASTNIPSDWLLLGKLLVRLLDSSVLGERLALHVVVGIVHVGGVLRVGHWLGLLHGVLIVLVH